jgi:hypothetical protein
MAAIFDNVSERRPGWIARLVARARRALPSLALSAIGGLLWASVMTASALLSIARLGWQTPDAYLAIGLLFFVGAAASFPIGLFAARFLGEGKPLETRFAAAFGSFAAVTIALTGFLFAMQFRIYFSEWHEPLPSIVSIFQFVHTTGSAMYQFAVLGVRMYLPLGLPALLLAAVWHARRGD